jgi:uncharacterized iron-regulated membrane protein
MSSKSSGLVVLSRKFRSYHTYVGLTLAILICISALTGILLALKKEFSVLQTPTQEGSTQNLSEWLPVADLVELATAALIAAHPEEEGMLTIDRLDVRPSNGVVKVLFKERWWEVQVDGKTGEVKAISKRTSDWIEAIHDGSIISDTFKLISMNAVGWGLLFMTLSGIWLWYGPKVIRARKKGRQGA